jgi:hypothetical protein
MKIQSNVICAVSCSPKTTLLKIETVFAGKIFVTISAVFALYESSSLHKLRSYRHSIRFQ